MLATSYTLSTTSELDHADAVERVRDELKAEGFGVLCEIDVQATLKDKLGVDGDPYVILGACNPPLAHQALETEPELGALLPCNVVVYQRDDTTHIAAIDADACSRSSTTTTRADRHRSRTSSPASSTEPPSLSRGFLHP